MSREKSKELYKTHRPGIKIGFALIVLMLVLAVSKMRFSLFILLFINLIMFFDLNLSFAQIVKRLKVPLIFLLISVLTVALQIKSGGANTDLPETQIILNFRILYISRESLLQAAEIFCRAFAAFSALLFIGASIELPDFFIFLRHIHAPEVFISLVYLMYRLIFRMQQRFQECIESQELRGAFLKVKTGFKSLGLLAGNMFSRIFKESEIMSEALELKFYQGRIVFIEPEYSNSKELNIRFAVYLLIVIAAAIIL